MPATNSTMLALGTPCPKFSLHDVVSGHTVTNEDFDRLPAMLVMFVCNHCPFVKHIREELACLGRDYSTKIGMVAISSNDPATHPQDGPDKMVLEATQAGYTFPYLFDDTQAVAKAFRAACTPDFFLFDADRKLVYRGQLDDSRPSNGKPVTGADLRAAIDAVLSDRPVPAQQWPSIGCNIKWKRGAEPDYAKA